MYTIQHIPGSRPHPPPPPPLSVPSGYRPPHNPYTMPTMALIQRDRDQNGFLIMEEPKPVTTRLDGKEWSLQVPQQPIRARMCGFGDKDRRPITPPPCVKLVVRDIQTGEEIDAQEIDISFFVITVDLWDEEAQKEVNLVKHAANSPSISTATAVAYPHTQAGGSAPPPSQPYYSYPNNYQSPSMPQSSPGGYYPNPGSQGYGPPQPAYPAYGQTHYGYNHTSFGPSSQVPNGQYPHTTQTLTPSHPSYLLSHQQQALNTPHQPTGVFTRNLIGALSASAFRLHDQHNQFGVWFILQDLSIRTDGIFRLKFNFVNVGVQKNDGKPGANPTSPMTPTSSASVAASASTLNTASAPVLASVFSAPFQVFSAKKFPGVIESTELSKTFAQQGIKIPIRKDGDGTSGKRRRNAEDEEDEGDEDQ